MIPRSEHPKPQFMRESWENLNGQWQFEADPASNGLEQKFYEKESFSQEITVPFCPESKLSGIGNVDFCDCVWYKRKININNDGKIVRLHFGAADYETTVYVNGKAAGTHMGGYTSFFVDITDYIVDGENEICVQCDDDIRCHVHPRGKQSFRYFSHGCLYTRTTGIWQTVWLEFVEKNHVEKVKYYPDIFSGSITVNAIFSGKDNFTFTAYYNGEKMGEYKAEKVAGEITFNVPLKEKHLWEVGNGNLYDVEMTFGKDKVKSYFGLRQVRLDGKKFLINEKSVFQRLVLDQGFYPDGIYTAPTDADFVKDIELSLKAGFNGARLHEKVFEERFLYHADRLGYIVWGEFGDWGIDHTEPNAIHHILPQWIEAVDRDFNHPAINGWCPLNEVWDLRDKKPFADNVKNIYRVTKAMDSTRPCIDASGGIHYITDIYDTHDYNQDYEKLYENYKSFKEGGPLHERLREIHPDYINRQAYGGQPCFISEYGGTAFKMDESAWAYGKNHPKTKAEFYERFKGITDVFLDNPNIFGVCYTQLTNVEQEQNGIYFYDRTEKFDVTPLREALQRKAAIED